MQIICIFQQVDESVNNNLMRLLQPSYSIPNIGRKSLRQQENLAPKAKSLLQKRPRLPKPTPHGHLLSPSFRNDLMYSSVDSPISYGNTPTPHGNTPVSTSSSWPSSQGQQGQVTLHAVNMDGHEMETKRWNYKEQVFRHVDMDSMQTFCYDYYLSKDADYSERNKTGVKRRSKKNAGRTGTLRNLGNVDHLKDSNNDYNGEYSPGSELMTISRSVVTPYTNNDVAVSDAHNTSTVRLPDLPGMVIDDETNSSKHFNGTDFKASEKSRDIEETIPVHGNDLDVESESFKSVNEETSLIPRPSSSTHSQKKHIVVAMPNIIFNAEKELQENFDYSEDVHQLGSRRLTPETSVRKTFHPQESRDNDPQTRLHIDDSFDRMCDIPR